MNKIWAGARAVVRSATEFPSGGLTPTPRSQTMEPVSGIRSYRALVENLNDAIFALDAQGSVTYVSPVIEQLIHYGAEQINGGQLSQFAHPEDVPHLLISLKRSLAGGSDSFEFRAVDKKGEIKYLRVSCRRVGRGSQPAGLVGILSDITKKKWIEQQIRDLSFRDRLTGVYTRSYFEEELRRLDTPRQLPLSIVISDVNGLKLANDAFGHDEGDRLLQKAAAALRESCRREDMVARWGGDEFAMVLPRTSHPMALKIISRIKRACDQAPQALITLSIAMGAATKTRCAQDVQCLMKEAENAMYRQKLLESEAVRGSIVSHLRRVFFERYPGTEAHALRLQGLALQLGRSLGLAENVLEELALLANWHDVGEIGVPEETMIQTNNPSIDRWEVTWKHPEIGYRIASSSPKLVGIAEAILAHHECWDGTGFPRGLKGEQIPLLSRILSVVDAYDGMIQGQPNKKGESTEGAIHELRRRAGNQLDSELVDMFLRIMCKPEPELAVTER